MEIGLRILALVIDVVICFGTLPLVLTVSTWPMNLLPDSLGFFSLLLFPVWLLLFILWPILCLAIPTGIWGRTLGKLICRLKVTDSNGDPPGIWRALGREVLKCLAIGSFFFAILLLFQIVYQGRTWYDQLCGTLVEFKPYVRLTKTQRNYRKYMKNR